MDGNYWREPAIPREASFFNGFRHSLDSLVSPDDPVRLFNEVLQAVDWSEWEAPYNLRRGQPPIHPSTLAAVLLYGMYRGIRSSRKLEEACNYRLDFIWLTEGLHVDHTTLSKFRKKFGGPLKELFKQIGRLAMAVGVVQLGEVAFDGTRVRANNSRFETRTAKSLEQKLAALDELYDYLAAELEASDRRDPMGSATRLPEELADIEERRARLQAAHEQALAADEARRKQGIDPAKNPAQVPMTDPDSRVMPNKEGGFAPNFTPVLLTDGHQGFVLECDVLAEVNESSAIFDTLDSVQQTYGRLPEHFLTDGGNASGPIMKKMEDLGVELYVPVTSTEPQPGDVAYRDDPRLPVASSEYDELPKNNRGQLDKSCFMYVPAEDAYYCPQGRKMPYEKQKGTRIISGVRVKELLYRSENCNDCPLASICLSKTNEKTRTIMRDEHTEVRERTAARMKTAEARKRYNRRPQIAESPFGILKRVMGFRQFLLRGLENVKTEWRWAVTAFNIGRLIRLISELRAQRSAKLCSAA